MRSKKSQEKIDEMLDSKYGNRISLAGTYHGRRSVCLFYCHSCVNWFWQSIWSLQNGYRTRCLCSYAHRLPTDAKGRSTSGHRCLHEWDCYDRVPPQQRPETQEPI